LSATLGRIAVELEQLGLERELITEIIQEIESRIPLEAEREAELGEWPCLTTYWSFGELAILAVVLAALVTTAIWTLSIVTVCFNGWSAIGTRQSG
jgi:hypothetical protein